MYFTLRFVAVAPRNGSGASIVGGTPVNGPSLLMNILLVKIKLTRARKWLAWTIVSELPGWLAEEGSREMLQ